MFISIFFLIILPPLPLSHYSLSISLLLSLSPSLSLCVSLSLSFILPFLFHPTPLYLIFFVHICRYIFSIWISSVNYTFKILMNTISSSLEYLNHYLLWCLTSTYLPFFIIFTYLPWCLTSAYLLFIVSFTYLPWCLTSTLLPFVLPLSSYLDV